MASQGAGNHPQSFGYSVALLAVVGSLLLRWALSPWLGTHLPFLTIFGAVAVAVWYGGWRAGVFGAALGFLGAVWLFFEPEGQLRLHKPFVFVGGLGFFASCGLIVFFGEAMLRARATARLEASQRAESEEGQRRQREFLKVTLASIGDGVIATDPAGKVFFLNAEAERLTGWSSEDAAGQPLPDVFRIVNEQSRKPVESPVEKVLRTGKTQGLANHTILISKSGSEIPIDDSAAPIRGADGDLQGVILVFRDVTEQRRAMLAADRLAAIVEHSAEAIFTKDINGMVQSWNASAKRLFGYEAEEIVGKHITMLFPPDRLAEEDHILKKLREGSGVERYETVRVAKDGKHLRVQISVSPLKDDEGQVIGASKIVHDITEVAEAREALMRERELLATTLASIGDAVIVTDTSGGVTFLNREAERLTGWAHRDAAGKPLPEVFSIVNEQTRQPAENPVQKVLRTGEIQGLANHTILIAKDGREMPIDDSAAPILGSDGTLHGVVLVFRDFSEQRQSAEALQRNYERSQQLAEDLESALQAKDQFLAQLSHELRTPLNPVLMLASARANDSALPQAVRQDLEMIRRNIALEARLIDDLLDLTRIAKGKLRLRLEPCDLHEIINDAIEIVRDSVHEKQIKLEVKLEAREHRLHGDATRLHQVFWNLLRNAVKFTPKGRSIFVQSSDQDQGENGLHITVAVRDEGIGFEGVEAESLFEPFRQVDEGGSVGLGLGLSIARAIVHLHQGTITAWSAGAGTGAEFTVRLPVAVPDSAWPSMRQGISGDGRPVKGLRLLVVEDHPSTLEVITKILEGAGHSVTAAVSLDEARTAASKWMFDGVITDLGLPDGSGIDLLQELQAKWKHLPGIALSGYGADGDVQRSMEAGFLVHIVKPIEIDELHRAIRKIADGLPN